MLFQHIILTINTSLGFEITFLIGTILEASLSLLVIYIKFRTLNILNFLTYEKQK